jgi:methionyl aminopeptidase
MYIKSEEEIKYILEGGKILGQILAKLSGMLKPGMNGKQVDEEAEKLILSAGGLPAFKNFQGHKSDPPFPSTVCFCLNDELVHGIASANKIIKTGDIVSLDIGMQYPVNCGKGKNGHGFFTDTAVTVAIGKVPKETQKLLSITKKALEIGIKNATVGKTVADIGQAIQKFVEPKGYGIVRDLVGHGVGHDVHEDPRVPNYFDATLKQWKLEPGVVIAIEPMVTIGKHHVKVGPDGWTIVTADHSLCGHFEHTIVITKKGPVVATRRKNE